MRPLGVAHLTALELPPGDLARLAARAGFRFVGLRVVPATADGPAYPTRVGTRAHEELRVLLDGEGVRLNDIEFVQLTPDVDVPSLARIMEAGADLGAASLTVSGDDADIGRLTENFAAVCDLAAGFGLRVDIEFMRWRVIGNLRQAAALVAAAERPNGAVLLDALHLDRSGGKPGDVRDLPPAMIRSVQLCDAAARRPETNEEVIAEARAGRLPPGEGTLPLRELVSVLSEEAVLGVEMPMPRLEVAIRLERAYRSAARLLGA